MSELYDQDFYAWTDQQARLLRAGHLAEADVAHLIEEIESMGRSERRELVNRLVILLLHFSNGGTNRPCAATPGAFLSRSSVCG